MVGAGRRGGVSRCHSIDRLPKLWLLHSFSVTKIGYPGYFFTRNKIGPLFGLGEICL